MAAWDWARMVLSLIFIIAFGLAASRVAHAGRLPTSCWAVVVATFTLGIAGLAFVSSVATAARVSLPIRAFVWDLYVRC